MTTSKRFIIKIRYNTDTCDFSAINELGCDSGLGWALTFLWTCQYVKTYNIQHTENFEAWMKEEGCLIISKNHKTSTYISKK